MPATNAVSERSFSALRRIKSYLRANMSQERLNQSMVLHVHKHLTDPLPPPFWNSYLVLFYAKSVGFWGGAPDPDGGACSAPPYLLAGREGCPPPTPSTGDATILFRPLHHATAKSGNYRSSSKIINYKVSVRRIIRYQCINVHDLLFR